MKCIPQSLLQNVDHFGQASMCYGVMVEACGTDDPYNVLWV